MNHPELVRLALVTAIAAALPQMVWAAGQDGSAPTAQADTQANSTPDAKKTSNMQPTPTKSLQTVVVTGNAGGVKKIDASYNVVVADLQKITESNAKSTADLLKISPGIWPESSGGQTGANIEIAGFPGGGDSPFFTMMVNGTPLYGMPSLSFMDSSSLFRLDDTIERVEIVQGGPGAIFGPGQMGATANFILRQGTEVPSGDIGVTYGSEGLYRVDGFYGFPIAQNWYGSIGGFYRKSDGVRDPQYPSDNGGQLTATLTHDLDNGTLMFWARSLDDKNQFIAPTAMIQNSNGSYSSFPGFDALTGTYYSKAIQHVQVPGPYGNMLNANLANGRGGKLNYFGGTYSADFGGGWKVDDHYVVGGGQLNTNALFSGSNPKPLSYYAYGCNIAQPAGYCSNTNQPVDSDTLSLPAGTKIQANYVGGGAVPLNQSVIHQGWWYIQKQIHTFNNDFRLSKELFDGNTLTAGYYFARSTDNDNWSLGNQMLMSNTNNAKPITLSYVQNGQTMYVTNPQGFSNFNGNFDISEHNVATNNAFYLSDSWRTGPWLLDASARLENIHANQSTCNFKTVQLGTANDLYDNAVQICDGTFTNLVYNKTHPSFTVGANYELADNMSVYARGNTGGHFDDFDNGIRGTDGNFSPMEKIRNLESGFKYQSSVLYVDASIYFRKFTGLQYQETNGDGVPVGGISNYGSSTKGLNLNTTWSPIENLKLSLVGDYMDGHYTNYNGCAQYTDINGGTECVGLNGEPLQRQPKVRYAFTPSYRLPTSWGDITAFVTYTHVGQRYEDQSGLQPLGSYYTLDAGIVANYQSNWQFTLRGTNLTNQIGLTEGNSRIFGVNTGIGGVILARSIEGREVNLQAKYSF